MAHLDTERLTAFIDQELPPADMAQVEEHLATCAACLSEYQQLLGVATLVRELPVYQPQRPVLIDADAHNRDSGVVPVLLEFARPVALAAVIILVALAGLRLATDSDDPPDDAPAPISEMRRADQEGGTDSDAQTSETVPAPERAAPDMAEAPIAGTDEVADSALRDADEAGDAPGQAAEAPPAETPEDAAGFGLTEAVVIGIVVLVAGAAAWRVRTRVPSNQSRA